MEEKEVRRGGGEGSWGEGIGGTGSWGGGEGVEGREYEQAC